MLVQNIRNKDVFQKPPCDWSDSRESGDDWPAGAARIGWLDPAFPPGLGRCLHSWMRCCEEESRGLSCGAANHPRPGRLKRPNRAHKRDRRRRPAGMAGIDRSGLIGGSVAGWVKGLRPGSDPHLLAVRVCRRTPVGILHQQKRDGHIYFEKPAGENKTVLLFVSFF